MGFRDCLSSGGREQKTLEKGFREKFVLLRSKLEEVEQALSFLAQEECKDQLEIGDSLTRARAEVLENHVYELLSRGPLEEQQKVFNQLDKVIDKNSDDLKCLFVTASTARARRYIYVEHVRKDFWREGGIALFDSRSGNASQYLGKDFAEQWEAKTVKLSYEEADSLPNRISVDLAVQAARGLCAQNEKTVQVLQSIFDDNLADLRGMVHTLAEALISITQDYETVMGTYSHFVSSLEDQDLLEDIDQEAHNHLQVLASVRTVKI